MSNTLFITGATSGFGEACARRFCRSRLETGADRSS